MDDHHCDQVFNEICDVDESECKDVNCLDSDTITDLGGFTICGKRSGQSFLYTQSPQADGTCPSITCNPNADINNKTCKDIAIECPINFMDIVSSIDK